MSLLRSLTEDYSGAYADAAEKRNALGAKNKIRPMGYKAQVLNDLLPAQRKLEKVRQIIERWNYAKYDGCSERDYLCEISEVVSPSLRTMSGMK